MIEKQIKDILEYFNGKLIIYGATPRGVDWNSVASQTLRYEQILKVCKRASRFSLIDYGCGYGGLIDYLDQNDRQATYVGYDPLQSMIEMAQDNHKNHPDCTFTSEVDELQPADYVVASGIFNVKLDIPVEDWKEYCLSILQRFNRLGVLGFSFNMLTKYSDAERMRRYLYYADPLFFFDYCKQNFSKDIALLHDYGLYDFTILVRKDFELPSG